MIKWLMHDDREDLFNILVALALNGIFLGLVALMTWSLDRLSLVLLLTRGYGVLWIAVFASALLLTLFHQLLRMSFYDRYNGYVATSLVVSGLLQQGGQPLQHRRRAHSAQAKHFGTAPSSTYSASSPAGLHRSPLQPLTPVESTN
jgi:hypothetical protein